jgi:penicillin-binding protein 1C
MTMARPRARRILGAALAAAAAAVVWLRCGPLPPGLLDLERRPSLTVVARDGETLYEARSARGLRSAALDPSALPPRLVQATMAAEDVRFRWHPGIDPIGILRALAHDIRAGRAEQGGSTITQQVAKLLLARQTGAPAHGWRAKLYEAVVAVRLEHRLSKTGIMTLYLNLAPYGNQIEGAQRAAQAYFGRAVSTLTPAETAFLAALPQQPSRFNPWRSADAAEARRRRILTVMARRGWLNATELATAEHERLQLSRESTALLAPHFVERVLTGLDSRPARRVVTTLDPGLQRTVHGIIEAEREGLRQHHASNVAVAVLDNRTGGWLAWEGSGEYFDARHGGAIDGVVTPRQPGLALKPFTYAAAFEGGAHPGRVLADVPSQFPTVEPGVLYSPRNYDGRFRGPLLARAALAGSENVPAVALASDVGVPVIARLLRRAGITTLDRNASYYGLGLTLGNAEVRLDELVAAYAMLARGGDRLVPRLVTEIDGRAVPSAAVARVVSTRTAFWIGDILADAGARSYVFGRGGSLEFPFTVAAKTGTSQSYFDNWAIGYTRDVTVGVWVGNFDRTPLTGSSGVTGAGPIFHAVLLAAVERVRGSLPLGDGAPIVPRPEDLHPVELCGVSGELATEACPTRTVEWLPAGAAVGRCLWHHASDRGVVTVWPEIFRGWAREHGLLSAPAAMGSVQLATAVRSPEPRRDPAVLSIARPLAGAVYLYDDTLRSEYQALNCVATGGAPGPLEWFIDGRRLATPPPGGSCRWPLVRGHHDVVVRDQAGHEARTSFDVR